MRYRANRPVRANGVRHEVGAILSLPPQEADPLLHGPNPALTIVEADPGAPVEDDGSTPEPSPEARKTPRKRRAKKGDA